MAKTCRRAFILVSGFALLAKSTMPAQRADRRTTQSNLQSTCNKAVFEGEIVAGQSYEKPFTSALKLYLEPLRSGWILRVLPENGPRGAHDYAELATPPYQSVSPLLISTDWSFRAQDAVAWNPRRFQYARDQSTLHKLEELQPKVLAGDMASSGSLASLVAQQPQGTLKILDARFAPGTANQSAMAAAVASHLATTPHTVDTSSGPSALGRLESLRFRVELALPAGQKLPKEIHIEPCKAQPTGAFAPASQQSRARIGR